jgi:preprotein translocase subunit SecF
MSDQPSTRNVFGRLYHGETNYDFIGRTRLWFTISGVIIFIGLVSLLVRGLNFGIDFKGGVVWEVPANGVSVAHTRDALSSLGLGDATIQTVSGQNGTLIRVEAKRLGDTSSTTSTTAAGDTTSTTAASTTTTAATTSSTAASSTSAGETTTSAGAATTGSTTATTAAVTTTTAPSAIVEQTGQERRVSEALAKLTGNSVDDVSFNFVGATWGSEISKKAVKALIVFLVAITLYISLRFEFKMAMPTLLALLHDIAITVGIYSLAGFPVTPATVIAVLTILGYSIYDGIVVFDKVDENTRLVSAQGRMTYGDMVNLSLNQTLMRSVNTSLTALLPIASLLIVGAFILGATTLQEFALALFIGLTSGAYSSMFVASPLLVVFKEREPRYRDLRRRLEARTDRRPTPSPAAAAAASPATDVDAEPVAVGASTGAGAGTTGSGTAGRARPAGAIPPRPRKKGKRR